MPFITALVFCIGTVSSFDATGTENCFWVEFSNRPRVSFEECGAHISRLQRNSAFLEMINQEFMKFPNYVGAFNAVGYCPSEDQWENFQREMGVALQDPKA